MIVHHLQIDLPRLAIIFLAASFVFFTMGPDRMAKAGQQPNSEQSQEKSSGGEFSREQLDRTLRQFIIDDIQRMLLSNDSTTEATSEAEETVEKLLHTFTATAYCIKNITACGVLAAPGIVAADPSVLPLGSIIRIEAGRYSGFYRVLDTGPAVRGKRLDIYMNCRSEAIHFGRRKVKIEIVRYGWNEQQAANSEKLAEGD